MTHSPEANPSAPNTPGPETQAQNAKTSLTARLLTTAVKAWLRSQLDTITDLKLQIYSGNRQLLGGTIPKIELSAHQAVYQGLHLQDLNVIAQQIRVNLRQIARGKAFQLLEPILIDLDVKLAEDGLQASLPAPLLQSAFQDLLDQLFAEHLPFPVDLSQTQINLEPEQVILRFSPLAADRQHPLHLQTGVRIGAPNELVLSSPQWWIADPQLEAPTRHSLSDYTFNLGSQANIQTLTLTPTALHLGGKLQIMP